MKFFQTHTAAILLALMALMTADVALGYEFSVNGSADATYGAQYTFDEISARGCGGDLSVGEIEEDSLSSLNYTASTADATSFTRSSDSAMATFSTHNQALTIGGLGLEVYRDPGLDNGLSVACAPPVDDQQGTPHHTRDDDLTVDITYIADGSQAASQGNTVDEDWSKMESRYFQIDDATEAASYKMVEFPLGPMTLGYSNDDDDAQNNDDHGKGNVSVSTAYSF